MTRLAGLALATVLLAITGEGCRRSRHTRVAAYTPPALQAGFVERTGTGWRIAVPSTWRETRPKWPAVWSGADPQPVDDFRANVSLVAESFEGESYDYARANEAALGREPRATVETAREEVVDGDLTLLIESRWAPAPASPVSFRTLQSALASRGAGYVVTCSVAATAFMRYRSSCESIVRSFAVER